MACQGEGRRSLLKASRVHLTKTGRSQKEGAAQSHLGENSRQGPQAPPPSPHALDGLQGAGAGLPQGRHGHSGVGGGGQRPGRPFTPAMR